MERFQEYDIGPRDPVDPDPDQRGQGNGEWLEDRVTCTLRRWGYRTWTRVRDTVEEIDVIGKRSSAGVNGPKHIVVECKDYEGSGALIGRSVIDRLVAVTATTLDEPGVRPILCHTTDLANWETVNAIDAFGVVALHVEDLSEFPIVPDSYPPREAYLKAPYLGRESNHIVHKSRLEYDPHTSDEFYRLKGTNTQETYEATSSCVNESIVGRSW